MKGTPQALEALLHNAREAFQLPGLAASVSLHGNEWLSVGLGHRDAGEQFPVSADTVFGVASVTKTVTAALMLQADRDGVLHLSDPVSRWLPGLSAAAADHRMELRHFLNHSAGFPGLPCRFHVLDLNAGSTSCAGGVAASPETGVGTQEAPPVRQTGNELGPDATRNGLATRSELVAFINSLDMEMLGAPGEIFNYFNEGYCLLGGVLEEAYMKPYASIAAAGILEPLGMGRSTIGGTHERDAAIPLQRTADGFSPLALWDAPLFYPAGGLMTSVRDMTRLFDLFHGSDSALQGEQLKRMWTGPCSVPSRPSTSAGYGYGLEVEGLASGKTFVWHSGQRAGISSFAGHVIGSGLSLALAANVSNAPLATIAHGMLAELLGDDEIVWPRPQKRFALTGKALSPRFVGTYSSAEAQSATIRFGSDHDGLMMDNRQGSGPLRFHGPAHGTVGHQTFHFLSDPLLPDGPPAALALDLRILPRERP